MATAKRFPWHVPFEEYREMSLKLRPNAELMDIKKKLDALRGYATGHVEAYFYHKWAEKQGRAKVVAFWKKFAATK